MKKRFIAYAAMSIDGRIALQKRKLPNWTSKEDWQFFQKELAKADAVVTGRNTFEAAKSRLARRNTFVLTSRARGSQKTGNVTFVNPRRVDLRKIFAPYRRVAVVGGARVYQYMLDQGLMDQLYLTIEPIVFGRGVPLFEGGKGEHRLRLTSVKRLNKKGTILLSYVASR